MIGRLSRQEAEQVLRENLIGRIGCNDGQRTYVVPLNYVFDGISIILHSAEGMKVKMMRKNAAVCFQVDQIISFTNWKSVIIWGRYQEITDEMESYDAIRLFVDRRMPVKISGITIPPESSERRTRPRSPGNIKPVIYRIVIEEMTGKYERD